jgi:hypothetical protein
MEQFQQSTPSPNSRYRSVSKTICILSPELISKISSIDPLDKQKLLGLQCLDLHIREKSLGEIYIIENLHICRNLKLLNLSYNSITVSMYVCMYVYNYQYIYTYIYTYIHDFVHICLHRQACLRLHKCG